MLVNADKKWDYALGMIKVDGLEPPPEMKQLIEREKRGEITTDDMKKALDKKSLSRLSDIVVDISVRQFDFDALCDLHYYIF